MLGVYCVYIMYRPVYRWTLVSTGRRTERERGHTASVPRRTPSRESGLCPPVDADKMRMSTWRIQYRVWVDVSSVNSAKVRNNNNILRIFPSLSLTLFYPSAYTG